METSPFPNLTPSKDVEHLRLLSIFHYVVGGIGALFACFPLIHVGIGVMMVANPETIGPGTQGQEPTAWIGYLFIGFGMVAVIIGWALAICTILSGRYMAKRQKRTFSFVVGAISCTFVPIGTVLGVFTLIVLSRESVQRLYEKQA